MLKMIVLNGNEAVPKVLPFNVPSEEFDLKEAIREAALEYAATKEGRKAFCGRDMLDLAVFMETVPDFFCRKHGFEKAEGIICDMQTDEECTVLQKEEMPKENLDMTKDMTPEKKICDVGVQFGRMWGVMETLGFLKGHVPDMAAHWAMEYLECSENDPFAFFEKKMKGL